MDRCTSREWQELMKAYLNKKDYSSAEIGQEIFHKLMGLVKDVVRICIRNKPLINVNRDPQILFFPY